MRTKRKKCSYCSGFLRRTKRLFGHTWTDEQYELYICDHTKWYQFGHKRDQFYWTGYDYVAVDALAERDD